MSTPAAEPVPPRELGEFTVVGVLGSGGSGVVLDARWGHREVALKVLHPTLVATEREKAQFFEEARRLQEISHPGVVKVLASGELPDGRPYLAMEKLVGPTLASRLGAGALPTAQVFGLFEQLAGAVQALHDRGLVHRDLKPENVVLVGDAHAVLLDFGIAKELAAPASTTTLDGGVRGTPAYMAPERFFGQPATVATDVYELAVTLYAMLAGKLPWADCGDPEVRLNPASLGDAAPAAVDVEIRRALSTRAQNRPASARELAAAVLAAAGRPVTTPARTTTQVPAGAAPGGPAWFERAAAGQAVADDDKGVTPLAWAPTGRAGQAEDREASGRTWWPLAAAVVAAAAAIVGWIVVTGEDDPIRAPAAAGSAAQDAGSALAVAGSALAVAGSASASSGAADPWSPSAPAAVPRPIAELRAEMTAAVGKLPAETRLVVALGIAELRADRHMGAILAAAAARPEVQLMLATRADCPIGLAEVDWVVFGFGEPDLQRQADIIIRGRWTRPQLEACLARMSGGSAHEDPDTKAVRFDGDRASYWVAFDGPVAVISTRDDGTGGHVAALAGRTAGPGGATGALIETLDRDASTWIAIDAGAGDRLEELGSIPAGTDAAMWVRVDEGARGRIVGRFRTAAGARAAEAYVRDKLAGVKAEGGDLLGRFELARTGKDVVLDAWLTPMTLGFAATALTSPTSD